VTPAFSKQLNFQGESNAAPRVRKDILKWNLQIYVNIVDKGWRMVISFSKSDGRKLCWLKKLEVADQKEKKIECVYIYLHFLN